MALGLLLGVSWICLFVFNGSDGLPATKGYGYPHKSDTRNMDEDTYDDETFQASDNEPTGPVYTSYNTPTVAQQPVGTLYGQNPPNTQSNQVERLINGVPRDWGQANLNKPIVFPLPSNPAKPQPGPVQPQSSSFSVSTNDMPNHLRAGASTRYASQIAYQGPSSNFQARESPNLSLQMEPLDSGYGVIDFNAGSSAAGGNVPHLVYEDVFLYPETPEASQSSDSVSNIAGGYGQADVSRGPTTGYSSTYDKPSFPSYPTNVKPRPLYLPWRRAGTPGGISGHSGQPAYQPRDEVSTTTKNFNTKNVEVNQRVSEPIPPPPPPSSYIVQSSNSYTRRREFSSKTKYTPEFTPLTSVSSKGPAPSQPAAPKNAKNPKGAKW